MDSGDVLAYSGNLGVFSYDEPSAAKNLTSAVAQSTATLKELVKDNKPVDSVTVSATKEKEVIEKPIVSVSPSSVSVSETTVPAPSAAKPEFNLGQIDLKVDVKKEAAAEPTPVTAPVSTPAAAPLKSQALS